MSAWAHADIRALVELAVREDIGPGDVTSDRCIPADQTALGRFVAQAEGVLCGVELLPFLYELRGGVTALTLVRVSGDRITPGDTVARVEGPTRTLLECERTALNFIQRLSGVATLARRYADAVSHTAVRVLDTRKTTPGWRRLEKLAAAAGGVTNHRMGLYDAVLIKNNHITAAGGVRQALERFAGCDLPVEIEVRTEAEVDEALAAGAAHLLLDNQTPKQAAALVRHIAGRANVEWSGNITLETIRAYAEAAPDFISSGAITHQAQSLPFRFRIENQ